MSYLSLENEIQIEVSQYFRANKSADLHYHNLANTKKLVAKAQEIARFYKLDETDYFILTAAAYFLYTGYIQHRDNFMEESVKNASLYLQTIELEERIIPEVASAIWSTSLPLCPENLNEKILCDAMMFNWSTSGFYKKSRLCRKEAELFSGQKITNMQWNQKLLNSLEMEDYFTDYAKEFFEVGKQKNIQKIHKRLESSLMQNNKIPIVELKHCNRSEKKSSINDDSDKGIQTMFKITSVNNQRLSDMADNKAHILITVNSIIISLVISLLLKRLEESNFLIFPTFLFLILSLSCCIVSILATRPHIPNGYFSQSEIEEKKVNLLFFGNFYKMDLASYRDGMLKVMNDRDYLYQTLISDVYAQGVVLGKKYYLIRLAYNIFMFGLISAVLAFSIAYIFWGNLIAV